jgi:photosystem II stability/assembly factor-like uncharacterized protein
MSRSMLRILISLLLFGGASLAVAQTPKADTPATKADATKATPPAQKTEPKAEATKTEAKKAEAPKAEPPKAEAKAAPAAQAPGDKEKQITEIQRQIAELNRKLDDLKKPEPQGATFNADWAKSLTWRPLGPANMGGRIVAISVFEADPTTYFVATGGGGLLKTTNNGITFEHLFDKEGVVAIGDVCVAPSNREIVWVGTGENNPRNSVSYGDGVYKSTDGGKTWTHMGLKETFQIGRVIVHPTNPEIVYVGALGRLWGTNAERGLFKTTDGGKTWNKVLFVDDKTGVIDMRMHPTDPETLIVATWERQRDLYDSNEPIKKHAPGAGLHKTTDGGKTFHKLAKGLPDVKLGRIGIDWYRKDPKIVFAIIDSEKAGLNTDPKVKPPTPQSEVYMGLVGDVEDAGSAKVGEVVSGGPAEKAGLKLGDIITAVGDAPVARYRELVAQAGTKKPGDKAKLKVTRGDQKLEVEITFEARPTRVLGGGSEGPLMLDPSRPFGSMLGGQIENAQDRQGPEGYKTGGVYKSTDGGETWTRINSLNPRPMYFSQIRVDPNDDKYLYILGINFHRSDDGGKTFRGDGGRSVHADGHALWIDPRDGRHQILGCDGGLYATYDRQNQWDQLNHVAIGQFYHVALDTKKPYNVYGGLQDNGTWGGPSFSRTGGAVNENWINIGGGDGFKCQVDQNNPDEIYWTSQNGNMGRRNLRTGETASIRPVREPGKEYRFNWNTPFILSSHNSRIFYAAGNHVFRSLDRGSNLRSISPTIVRTDQGTATALAESPRNPDVFYVGTDDGLLWGTKDGGKNWTDLTPNVGLGGHRYVATIEPSRFEEGRVYVSFDGHRTDLDDPLPYVSEDFGKTWKPLRGNLPTGSSKCLREDIQNPEILWLGTEFAAWASIDRGKSWTRINGSLPTVAIMELAQHPTAGDIVAATHGRSLWAFEATPIRQTTEAILKEKVHLYRPHAAVRYQTEPARGTTNRKFVAPNPPRGAQIYVHIAEKPQKINMKVVDDQGVTARELTIRNEPGLHRVSWDLLRTIVPAPEGTPPPTQPRGVFGGIGAGLRRGINSGPRMGFAAPGMYRVVLTVDGKDQTAPLKLEADPAYPTSENLAEEVVEEDEDENDEEAMERREQQREGLEERDRRPFGRPID